MIDLDIPTNSPPQTNTLLHWMQTGLTPATAATAVNSSSGKANAFALQAGQTAAFATYLQPNPPARVPLSHRYTQILVDTSGVQQTALDSLKSAAQNRMGFKAEEVLTAAGLQNKVVAGNFYNVTNAGPASSSNSSSSGGSGSGSGAGGRGGSGSNSTSGRGGGGGSGGAGAANGTRPGTTTNGAVVQESKSMTALVLLVVATLFLGV
jgi:phosphatidylethanolamine-binding protein